MCFFVSFDILIQFLRRAPFGMEGTGRRLSGILSRIYSRRIYSKIFPFLPFAILFYSKKKKLFFTQLIIFSTLLISVFGILVSGTDSLIISF